MKKILQTTILSCALASTASASIGDLMYLRGDITYSLFNNVSIGNNVSSSGGNTYTIKGGKYRPKFNLGGIVGLGYNVNEKLRTEVIYNTIYENKFKYSSQAYGTNAKIKANINAFLGRVIYDFADLGLTQLYMGCGVGMSNVRHKITGTAPIAAGGSASFIFKSKNRNNLAYTLMAGTTTKVADSLHIEAGYSFIDYGQTSRIVGMGNGKITLRSHNISLGFRFDLM